MSKEHFTAEQRNELSALLRAKIKQKDIADILNKDRTAIYRELKRNSDANGKYHARIAKEKTKQRRVIANQRFKKIEYDETLEKYIIKKLTKKFWSPEQIAGRLKKKNSNQTIVCHETIYQYIYNIRPDLKKYLRCQKGKYRRKRGTRAKEKRREETKKRRIDKRPEIVERRVRIGDWEGDTIIDNSRKQAILTHVERKSGYLEGDKLNQKLAVNVKEKTIKRFKSIPEKKRYTITYDNGTEFSDHELIEQDTDITIYFAYPYHSWERGTNENTNGLLRQFFPKKTSFANITQEDVDEAVQLINHRPRKRLGYLTPYEVFHKCCTLD